MRGPMPIHLIKMAVGIGDLDHLIEVQKGRHFVRDGRTELLPDLYFDDDDELRRLVKRTLLVDRS